ncbi:MAG: hypothetical protein U9Q77_01260 [Candidatus Marinimicrobia bacterium]|nr:hypothetical protein [Candidatus Neomarinimicrobiota bacterium]
MDIKVPGFNPFSVNADKVYQQNGTRSMHSSAGEDSNFLQTLIEKEEHLQVQSTRSSVLSLPERATLHVLFGSERPDDSNFYGKNNSTPIYKGHLLDVAG